MKYFQLPQILYEKGKEYYLESEKLSNDEVFKGWWCCEYTESLKDGASVHFPPEATDGKEFYYLISCGQSKKAAEKDLLDRINRMTKVLTEKDKEKMQKEWEELKKKIKRIDMEDKGIITCEECVYSFDKVKSPDRVYCCKHKKSMFHWDTCDDVRDM